MAWERCNTVVHVRCVGTGQMPKQLDYAGLGASIALDGAGIWPNLPRSRCILRMQTYFQ